MHRSLLLLGAWLWAELASAAPLLTDWKPFPPAAQSPIFADGSVTLTSDKWAGLVAPQVLDETHVAATVTIHEAAKGARFFGQGWSAWPDKTFSDGGFDAGLLLRTGTNSGYRVQLSHKYQVVALVKWPEGRYVKDVPCVVKLKETHKLAAIEQDTRISVRVDGVDKILWEDRFMPLRTGVSGIAVHDGAKATFSEVLIEQAPSLTRPPPGPHRPDFSVRPFLGGRLFVFDGNEPVLQLHYEKDPSVFAKLRPG
ncbi:MAG: hypothetical protein ACKODH_03550 [Limisphaerales bacterium]